MTIPMEYQRASQAFEAFLAEAKDELDFTTRNPAYTTVQGTLLAFRRRLSAEQILRFANVLPPLLRAIFIADWRPEERADSFPSRDQLTAEVKGLRPHHNLSPDDSIRVVATVLRHHLDTAALDAVLGTMPEGAREFWQAD